MDEGMGLAVRRCRMAGVEAVAARSDRSYPRHTHDQFGIGVMVAGAHVSSSGRGEVEAHAGQLITVNPNEVHDGRPVAGGPRAWRMLYFDPAALEPAFLDVTDGRLATAEFDRPVADDAGLVREFCRLHASLTSAPHPAAETAAEDALLSLVAALISAAPPRTDGPRHPGVASAARRIDEAPEEAASLATLAAIAGTSRWHFARLFRAATGLPPHAYRIQRQLQKARRLIASGLPVAEVAAASGFTDQSHLTRHFTRAYGVGPGAYARALTR